MRLVWCLGRVVMAALLCAACKLEPEEGVPPDTTAAGDPPPFTLATLGGSLYTPGDGNVAWAWAFPGEIASPPEVALGSDGMLTAMVTIERRPKPAAKLLDDVFLLRVDGTTGTLEALQAIDQYGKFVLDTHGNVVLAWPTKLEKRAPDGHVLWSKSRTPENVYELVSVAIDSGDNLILGRVELNEDPAQVGNTDPKGFVELEKLDSTGNSLWSERFGDETSWLEAAYVAVDPSDDVLLLAGGLKGPFDFGGGAVTTEDALAKYDANGNYVFSDALDGYGPVGYQASSPVLADADGNIVVRTESVGDSDIGLGSLFCPSQYAFAFDPSGAPLWNECIYADDLALLPAGGFITATTLYLDVTVGTRTCTVLEDAAGSVGESEAMLSRYDAAGNWVATACAEDPATQFLGNVAPDPSGMFFMSAAFSSQLTLPGGTVVPAVDDYATALLAKVQIGN